MEGQIAGGAIGAVGKYDVSFVAGQFVIEADAVKGASSAGLIVKVDARQILDAIAVAIPGQIDDAVIKVLEAALLPPVVA